VERVVYTADVVNPHGLSTLPAVIAFCLVGALFVAVLHMRSAPDGFRVGPVLCLACLLLAPVLVLAVVAGNSRPTYTLESDRLVFAHGLIRRGIPYEDIVGIETEGDDYYVMLPDRSWKLDSFSETAKFTGGGEPVIKRVNVQWKRNGQPCEFYELAEELGERISDDTYTY
jgi:hypothetical protein